MGITDPVADMITRIRNGCHAGLDKVNIPASNHKINIVKVLKTEGYIKNYKLRKDGKQGVISVYFRFDKNGENVILGIKRISKPSCRVYVNNAKMPRVRGGLGTAIISTPKGVMTERDAKKSGIGGEFLGEVW